jgi:hypothetical protein
LKRIKYISRFARAMSEAEIENLGRSSARTNAELGITGILVSSGGIFFQVLEGPEEAVDDLYRKIHDDPRHTDVLLLGVAENVAERIFPEWSMGHIALDTEATLRLEPLREILRTIFEQRQILDRLTGALERAIWTEISRVVD